MPFGLVKLKHNLSTDGVRVGVCVVQPTLPKSLNELCRNFHDRETRGRYSIWASKQQLIEGVAEFN